MLQRYNFLKGSRSPFVGTLSLHSKPLKNKLLQERDKILIKSRELQLHIKGFVFVFFLWRRAEYVEIWQPHETEYLFKKKEKIL